MADQGRRKQLAKVLVSHDIDGSLEIKEIILNKPDGGEWTSELQQNRKSRHVIRRKQAVIHDKRGQRSEE